MKMARASAAEVDKCIKFFQCIEEYFERGTYTEHNTDNEQQLSDECFVELLRKMWGGRFRPQGVDCAWMRVVFGYSVLVDNCCDQNADTLEWKPEIASKLGI